MHPSYLRSMDRRARLRWVTAALAAYALVEAVLEGWSWMKPDRMARGRW
jgi:hypothetical protein